MDSYYPSLVSGCMAYIVSEVAHRLCVRAGLPTVHYSVVALLALTHVSILFFHFCTHTSLDIVEVLLLGLALLVLATRPSRRLKKHPWWILLGVGLYFLADRSLNWYPFDFWHGVPTVYLGALVWFIVARVFSASSRDGHLALLTAALGSFSGFYIYYSDFSLTSVFEAEYGRFIFLQNQFWISIALFGFSDVIAFMFRWIKLKTVKPTI